MQNIIYNKRIITKQYSGGWCFMIIRRDDVEASVAVINLVVTCYNYLFRERGSKAQDTHHQTIHFE